jgi:hypothetical protein
MSATSITLAGRAAAERLMVDACKIERITGETTNTTTGEVTQTKTTVYSGKCRVQQRGRMSRPEDVGEAYVFQTLRELQVPMAVTGVEIEDLVTVTASTLDPDAVGQTYWVRELWTKTHSTSRRLGIEEVGG